MNRSGYVALAMLFVLAVVMCLGLVAVMPVMAAANGDGWKSDWKNNTGDLWGVSNLNVAVDDLDDRLDSFGLTATNSTAFRPPDDNTVDLGSSTLEYKDLYLDGTANMDSISNSAAITLFQDIIGGIDGSYDLGSSTKEFMDLYIDGTANMDSISNSAAITLFQDMNPGIDDSYDLGSASKEYAKIYCDEMLFVDDITVGSDTGAYYTVTIDHTSVGTSVLYFASGVLTNMTQ